MYAYMEAADLILRPRSPLQYLHPGRKQLAAQWKKINRMIGNVHVVDLILICDQYSRGPNGGDGPGRTAVALVAVAKKSGQGNPRDKIYIEKARYLRLKSCPKSAHRRIKHLQQRAAKVPVSGENMKIVLIKDFPPDWADNEVFVATLEGLSAEVEERLLQELVSG
jgi:hypothetical protein